MNCTFYQNTTDKNVIDKTLTGPTVRSIVFLNSVDYLKPKITVKSLPQNANYCYIDALGRYYFIEQIEVLKNGLYDVYLSVDVLYTYRNDIKNSIAEIVESSSLLNADKVDYTPENVETVNEIALTNPFNTKSDVLITVNGTQGV